MIFHAQLCNKMAILKGEIHSVISDLRDRGAVPSTASLLAQIRGEADAMVLDLLIEADPKRSDGGVSASSVELAGYAKRKLETHMAFWVDGSGVHSMARLTVYGGDKKRVAVLSAVGTRASRRGRGLAKATVSSLLDSFDGRVRLVVDEENEAGKALYASLGFKRTAHGFLQKENPRRHGI